MVDIDEKVVECSKKYLPSFHDGSYSDERTVLLFEDGRKFLEEGDEKFDVIIMDITCPLEGGPSYKLFTREFYEVVKKKTDPARCLCYPGQYYLSSRLTHVFNTE